MDVLRKLTEKHAIKHVQKEECVNVYQQMTVQVAENVYNAKTANKLMTMVIAITQHIVPKQWTYNVRSHVSMVRQVIANACIGSMMSALNVQ